MLDLATTAQFRKDLRAFLKTVLFLLFSCKKKEEKEPKRRKKNFNNWTGANF
ncbi:MAG: hypothetical protein IKN12_00305 [Selenomonadaceae bacterium]|nr:hypothetical protein [Selenomonadaceae bacterium]